MRLRILGPLEVWDGAEWRRLGAPKWRSLLAALVIRSDRAVSVAELIDELWGDDPPGGAVNLVHGYVGRVRRVLDDRDGVRLRSRSPGYSLQLAPDDLDAQRFEDLAAEGVAAQARNDPAEAARLLGEALALWRGPAYADVDATPLIAAEVERLEERRLAVVEARIEAELTLGRHAEVVSDLQALVEAHPLREQLWRQLMLSLHRSRRQAEALEAYQRLYKLLDDELGLRPSRPLRDLQQQILTDQPELEPASDRRRSQVAVPRQVPAAPADFTAREPEVRRLESIAALASADAVTSPVVVVSGAGGVGKTTLAIHWAHLAADRFPDGQLYLDLCGYSSRPPRSAEESLGRLLRGLGQPPAKIPSDLDDAMALYRSLLSDRQVLVVLDNARSVDQVRPLVPGGRGSLALVTSRDSLTGLVAAEGAHVVPLDRLTPEEARQFLHSRLGVDRVQPESEAVDGIIAACARLPLALAVAAARAALAPARSLADLAADLAAVDARLDALDTGEPATDVRAVLSWSFDNASADAQRLFRLIGLHPGPDVSVGAAASLADLDRDVARRTLAELAGAHLVTERADGRYELHDLLQAYAIELAAGELSPADRDAALGRLIDHYLHSAHAANLLCYPHRNAITLPAAQAGVRPDPLTDLDDANAWFAADHQVLVAMVSTAADHGLGARAWRLAWELGEVLDRSGLWRDWAHVQEVALASADRAADVEGQAHSHRNLAGARAHLGDFGSVHTHLEAALQGFAALDDHGGQADCEFGIAWVLNRQGDDEAAVRHAKRAVELYEHTDQTARLARALNAIGSFLTQLGDYRATLEYSQRALTLLEEVGDRSGQASALDSLGSAHHRLGEHHAAIDCHRRALDAYEGVGARYHEAEILTNLGEAHDAAGERDEARVAWRAALDILDELDHPDAADVRARLAASSSALG